MLTVATPHQFYHWNEGMFVVKDEMPAILRRFEVFGMDFGSASDGKNAVSSIE